MHVSGIPVRADYRWFFVIGLMTAIIAASVNAQVGNGFASLVLGFVTTLVFFGSIFLHEFAHATVARIERLQVVEIVLHPFGGLTRFRHEPETPRAEFLIAIAGPVASFLLAILFTAFATAATSAEATVLIMLMGSLAVWNFLLAIFNLFPGYPLDGGRVLRAYLWRSGRDLNEATILTGRFGQAIAVIMIVFGILIAIARRDFFTGFWAILVGLFLWDSAKGIIREVNEQRLVLVEDVMLLPISADPESTIQQFVDNVLPLHRQAVFPVVKNRQLLGMLLLREMKAIDRSVWHKVRVGEAMQAVDPGHFVETGTPLTDVQEQMRTNGIGAVGVIDTVGKLVGFLHGSVTRKP